MDHKTNRTYLGPAHQEWLLQILDLEVVMLLVVVLVLLLPAVVIHEGVVGSLVEVDVIDPITLVVVSKQNTRMKQGRKIGPDLTW